MTIRKKPEGGLELVPGLGANSIRTILLVFVISMHPLGRSLLSTVGIRYPDEQKLSVATEKTDQADKRLAVLSEDVRDLKDSFNLLRADKAIVNAKLDDLAKTVNGFKIDLGELRQHVDFKSTNNTK